MKELLDLDLVAPDKNPNMGDNILPYQTLDKAIKDLGLLINNGRDIEKKKNRAELLLESVTHVESGCLFRILTGNYDKESIRSYLFPPPVGKKRTVEKS